MTASLKGGEARGHRCRADFDLLNIIRESLRWTARLSRCSLLSFSFSLRRFAITSSEKQLVCQIGAAI
jgi:hypothetical protein